MNKIHQDTQKATNYTKMQAGQEFSYSAEEMAALAKAAGYEIKNTKPSVPPAANPETLPAANPETPPQTDPEASPVPGSDTPASTIEDLKGQIRDNRAENKEMREQIHDLRQAERAERREQRRLERTQRREARQDRREDIREEKAEYSRIREAEVDFKSKGQIGKIVDGKYYINGIEVTKEVYEIAKLKAGSSASKREIKPFTREQMSNVTANVKNLKYEFSDNGLKYEGSTGFSVGKNDLMLRARNYNLFNHENENGKYELFGKEYDNFNAANDQKLRRAQTLSLHHAIYMDLAAKEKGGITLTAQQKEFMSKLEAEIAAFYHYTDK